MPTSSASLVAHLTPALRWWEPRLLPLESAYTIPCPISLRMVLEQDPIQ